MSILKRKEKYAENPSTTLLHPPRLLLPPPPPSLHPFHLAVATNRFIYATCSPEKYQPSSPFETNLDSLLSSTTSSAAQGSSYGSFAFGNDSSELPDAAVYGLYQCRADLKAAECLKCIQSVVSQISLVCPYGYGAGLQLDSCLIRYSHANFLGKLDTSLKYSKCSETKSGDADFFHRRDDVLDYLGATTAEEFRVSRSGLVQGFAQCVGDLNVGDCSACLSEAMTRLKSLCGDAVAAEVFLGECFARYWASGYYESSSGSSYDDDEVGKTVAIIVGIVAGLATMIVMLSICRKSLGKGH
ncbi:hypothetical protein NMG60_11029154 [Bertholletia excelsa]